MSPEEFREQVLKLFDRVAASVTVKRVISDSDNYCFCSIVALGNFVYSKIADNFETILEEILLNFCPECERLNKSSICQCKESEVI